MKTKTITLYDFDELSDDAKQKARDWLRRCQADDQDWADFTIQDAETICGILGIELDYRSVPLMNGKTRREPQIYYSGFWSQGDGACFTGRYSYAKGCAKNIREHAPQDQELHRIADGLTALQKGYGYGLQATLTKIDHHYQHEHTIRIDVEIPDRPAREIAKGDWEALIDLLRALMRWIYKQLEAEYEYQNSDEQIDETIRANEYTFTEDGSRED